MMMMKKPFFAKWAKAKEEEWRRGGWMGQEGKSLSYVALISLSLSPSLSLS